MSQNNFISIRHLTENEARKVYANLTKEKLIEMLIRCNKIIDELTELRQIPNELLPSQRDFYKSSDYQTCKSFEDCTNPHYDCINCPLRYGGQTL